MTQVQFLALERCKIQTICFLWFSRTVVAQNGVKTALRKVALRKREMERGFQCLALQTKKAVRFGSENQIMPQWENQTIRLDKRWSRIPLLLRNAIRYSCWCWDLSKRSSVRREPWSSGYGKRLLFQRSVSLNPSTIYWMDIFSHLFVVKFVMCVWKDENKLKRGRGWPIFKQQLGY